MSADGKCLAGGGIDGHVAIRKVQPGAEHEVCLHTPRCAPKRAAKPTGLVRVAFSTDGRRLAGVAENSVNRQYGDIRVWEMDETGCKVAQEINTLSLNGQSSVLDLAFVDLSTAAEASSL
jgi:hypothetical protein